MLLLLPSPIIPDDVNETSTDLDNDAPPVVVVVPHAPPPAIAATVVDG
jgi:hypothetical protein